MNWITKFIKPKIKSLLKKRSAGKDKTTLWTTCECKNLIYKDELFGLINFVIQFVVSPLFLLYFAL
jgi:hypothetical protein